jgi:hypothetical protein
MRTILASLAALVTLATAAEAAQLTASFGVGLRIVADSCAAGHTRGPRGRCQPIIHVIACQSHPRPDHHGC